MGSKADRARAILARRGKQKESDVLRWSRQKAADAARNVELAKSDGQPREQVQTVTQAQPVQQAHYSRAAAERAAAQRLVADIQAGEKSKPKYVETPYTRHYFGADDSQYIESRYGRTDAPDIPIIYKTRKAEFSETLRATSTGAESAKEALTAARAFQSGQDSMLATNPTKKLVKVDDPTGLNVHVETYIEGNRPARPIDYQQQVTQRKKAFDNAKNLSTIQQKVFDRNVAAFGREATEKRYATDPITKLNLRAEKRRVAEGKWARAYDYQARFADFRSDEGKLLSAAIAGKFDPVSTILKTQKGRDFAVGFARGYTYRFETAPYTLATEAVVAGGTSYALGVSGVTTAYGAAKASTASKIVGTTLQVGGISALAGNVLYQEAKAPKTRKGVYSGGLAADLTAIGGGALVGTGLARYQAGIQSTSATTTTKKTTPRGSASSGLEGDKTYRITTRSGREFKAVIKTKGRVTDAYQSITSTKGQGVFYEKVRGKWVEVGKISDSALIQSKIGNQGLTIESRSVGGVRSSIKVGSQDFSSTQNFESTLHRLFDPKYDARYINSYLGSGTTDKQTSIISTTQRGGYSALSGKTSTQVWQSTVDSVKIPTYDTLVYQGVSAKYPVFTEAVSAGTRSSFFTGATGSGLTYAAPTSVAPSVNAITAQTSSLGSTATAVSGALAPSIAQGITFSVAGTGGLSLFQAKPSSVKFAGTKPITSVQTFSGADTSSQTEGIPTGATDTGAGVVGRSGIRAGTGFGFRSTTPTPPPTPPPPPPVVPIVPPIVPPVVPLDIRLDLGGGYSGSRKKKTRASKASTKYTPSIAAGQYDIFGKQPKRITGLEIRPLLRKRSRKK